MFSQTEDWLSKIAVLNDFAVRKGRLKFDGWKLKKPTIQTATKQKIKLSDNDFEPSFKQKGVDMALGLDVAAIAATRRVDQFIIVSADTDMAPALKHGRINGMRAIIVELKYEKSFDIHEELKRHADVVREISIESIE